jgi:hypothetical protein
MAGFMDYFTGGGSGGGGFDMFGADSSGMGDLLTAKQQEAIKRQSMMAMAAQLLQAGGRSTQRTSLGQALGQGLAAGQQAQQTASTGAVNQLLMRSKLNEATRAQTQADDMRKLLMGDGGGGTASPEVQAINAPAAAGGALGPTLQRAAMIPQLAQAGMPAAGMPAAGMPAAGVPAAGMPAAGMPAAGMPAAGMPAGGAFSFLSPQQRAIMGSMKPDAQATAMLGALSGQQEYGSPMTFMRGGQPVMAQQNKFGQERVMAGASPYEAQSPDIRAVEYISGKPLAGTGTAGIGEVGQYRKQIAPKTEIINKLPAGPNAFVTAGGTAGMARLTAATDAAASANETLRNIDIIAPALDSALLGPGADYRTTMTRIGSQLGVAGKDAETTLQNTQQVVQGLARAELTAAAAMKGQGEITGPERALLRRTAAGDQSMTGPEMRTSMGVMQKLARIRHEDQLDLYSKALGVQGFAEVAPMFQITPYKSQFDLSSNVNLGSALQSAINKKARP